MYLPPMTWVTVSGFRARWSHQDWPSALFGASRPSSILDPNDMSCVLAAASRKLRSQECVDLGRKQSPNTARLVGNRSTAPWAAWYLVALSEKKAPDPSYLPSSVFVTQSSKTASSFSRWFLPEIWVHFPCAVLNHGCSNCFVPSLTLLTRSTGNCCTSAGCLF